MSKDLKKYFENAYLMSKSAKLELKTYTIIFNFELNIIVFIILCFINFSDFFLLEEI